MRDRLPIVPILIALAGAIGLGSLFFLGSGDGGAKLVQDSVIGTRTLGPWLKAGGIIVEESNPRLSPRLDAMGLRILPLYDLDLHNDITTAETANQAFDATSLVDLQAWVFDVKIRELPTLVVLPKWRQGMVTVEVAHESTLIPLTDFFALTYAVGLNSSKKAIKLWRPRGARFLSGAFPGGAEFQLFHGQLFEAASLPDHCDSVVSVPEGVLVAFCTHDQDDGLDDEVETPHFVDGTYYLSDPDLLNNHGLRLGGNAAAARSLIRLLSKSPKRPVYLDVSPHLLLATDTEDQGSYYQRDLGDFGRLFTGPFTVLWTVLLITMTVLAWRGSMPILPRKTPAGLAQGVVSSGQTHPGLASASAKARLLRLGGHDGHMVQAFVQSEILRAYRQNLGRGPGLETGENPMLARLHAIWARRDKTRADHLLANALALTTRADDMTPSERTRILNSFRENLEILSNENPDPGRISGHRHHPAP